MENYDYNFIEILYLEVQDIRSASTFIHKKNGSCICALTVVLQLNTSNQYMVVFASDLLFSFLGT